MCQSCRNSCDFLPLSMHTALTLSVSSTGIKIPLLKDGGERQWRLSFSFWTLITKHELNSCRSSQRNPKNIFSTNLTNKSELNDVVNVASNAKNKTGLSSKLPNNPVSATLLLSHGSSSVGPAVPSGLIIRGKEKTQPSRSQTPTASITQQLDSCHLELSTAGIFDYNHWSNVAKPLF